MTDDERMDRARRIREMREGSRPTDEEQSADSPADDSASTDADDSASTDAGHSASTETEADGAGTDDRPDAGSADHDPDAEPAEPDETGSAVSETGADSGDHDANAASADRGADSGAGAGADDDPGAAGREADAEGSTGGTVHVSSAEFGDVEVDVEEMARQAGLESADGVAGAETDDDSASGAVGPGTVAGADAAEAESAEETRVLEFALGDEQYCLDIEYVEEIVKRETVTRVPNTPDCVEGVVDLRGQITTILDPKTLLDIDQEGSKDLIVVFDPDQFDDHGAVGWVVDDVDRVIPVTEDEVNSSPVEQEHVNGVVDRDGEFVIWTTPELDVEELAG